jgi:hypothetical protein
LGSGSPSSQGPTLEAQRQEPCLVRAEVREVNAPSDVERRSAWIADQVARRRDPQQAEGEPLEDRILRLPVVALADPGKELVRAERQRPDGIHLVDEDHEAGRSGTVKDHLPQGAHEAPQGALAGVLLPECFQLLFQVQLGAHVGDQALVPLRRGNVLPERGEVENDDPDAVLAEAGGSADHEGALAQLAGGQDVAELSPGERLVEFAVCFPLHVTRRVVAEGAADDVERPVAGLRRGARPFRSHGARWLPPESIGDGRRVPDERSPCHLPAPTPLRFAASR